MFGPHGRPADPPTDITLRSRAALRVMSATDVRQHTILLDFHEFSLHERLVQGKKLDISHFWI